MLSTLSRPVVALLTTGLLIALVGCGSDKGDTVSGTVKFDGQPVDDGRIEFCTPDGTGVVASAPISKGAYQLPPKSAPPGTYRVRVTASKKTGKKIPAGSPSPPGTMVDEEVELIPEQYHKKSKLDKEVKAGPNVIDFDLTSK